MPEAGVGKDSADFAAKTGVNRYPRLGPRIWHGMPLHALRGLLRAGGLRNVGLRQWPMVLTALLTGLFNSAMERVQIRRYGARIGASELKHPPLFILGHWRTGTTLLHEFLALDERHRAPTTFECLAPAHCLVAGYIRKLNFLVPGKRPMDEMDFGWDRPQEDEFALMNMGLPSVYRQIGFPNNAPIDRDYLDFSGVSDTERRRWVDGLKWFVKLVAFRSPKKRIVLKSPQHLGRVRVLLEAFPDARFVHIVRDPHKIFPSTVKLLKALAEIHAFQRPRYNGLEETVFSCFERMYRQFEHDRHLVPADRLYELRYEDLIADPERELKKLYDGVGLGELDRVLPRLRSYLGARADYRTNTLRLDSDIRDEIDRRWGPFMRRYGYCGARRVHNQPLDAIERSPPTAREGGVR